MRQSPSWVEQVRQVYSVRRAITMSPSKQYHEGLNVIIPIGGMGTRFARQGYRFPKPLINIVGHPMLLWLIDNLSITSEDTLWIAVNEAVDDEFRIGQLVCKSLPRMDIRTLRLRHQTKGASETLYIVAQSMDEAHLGRKTVSLDCDTIYWTDVLQQVRDMPSEYGGCFYFQDNGHRPIFSYIETETQEGPGLATIEVISDIAEKRAISKKANTGAYVFPTAELLKSWAAQNLDQERDNALGEYFTSQLIRQMLKDGGIPFVGLPITVNDFSCVGTPEQLVELLARLKSEDGSEAAVGAMTTSRMTKRKRRFCFDLDMTLVGVPRVPGDYSTCPPIDRNIWLVRQLYSAGHHIIIQTARRMRTHNGNVGAVIADVGTVTMNQLKQYEIPYHDIHFGKPYADAYIDDLAINANIDTMREIGWMLDDVVLSSNDRSSMIAARDFNTIQTVGDKVIKSSKSHAMLGELFFYCYMPKSLSPIFPTIYDADWLEASGTYSVSMEKIGGTTFSHLLVGRSLTPGRLLLLLRTIHAIHQTRSEPTRDSDGVQVPTVEMSKSLESVFDAHRESVSHQGTVNIYANYATKLRQRYDQHRKRYNVLGPLASSLFRRIHEFLDTYEAEDKGFHAQVIHGDPVFSNAILDDNGKGVRLIDMRGQLDEILTTEGDVHYDLAKILQSLCGYDHILFLLAESERDMTRRQVLTELSLASQKLLDETADVHSRRRFSGSGSDEEDTRVLTRGITPLLSDVDRHLLDDLQEEFFRFIEDRYAVRIHRKTLLRITASLLFSLIPLHRPELGPIFLRMCSDALDRAGEMSASGKLTRNPSMAGLTR